MASQFFSQNMETLKKVFPRLAGEIENLDELPMGDLKIETASSGSPTLVSGGVYIHSKRDPEKEAQRLVDSLSGFPGESSAFIVLGFGLGYAACILAEKFPQRPIIIVEKRLDVLGKALQARDLGAFLSRQGLVFVLGGEGVTAALSLFRGSSGENPVIIENRALTGMDEEWYADVAGRVRSWNSRSNVNLATLKRFGRRWVQNLSRNFSAIRDIPGISRLEGIIKDRDIPVFLAAGGPTLDASGPILREIAERCVIVAVDTSLRFLSSRNIDSDFVVSVDPQYWNFRHLDRQSISKIRLIAECAVYPPCLRLPFGGKFLSGSFFPLGRFIEDRVDPKGVLGAGGSVATSAWDFARLLGGRKLWIAGLDLSFPELKTHFRGAIFEEKSHTDSRRFAPAETWNFHALRDGQPFLAKSTGGGMVLTDKRLSLYASWFENSFARFPEVENCSLSAEGLAIEGLKCPGTDEMLALNPRREEINSLLAEADRAIEKDFYSREAGLIRAEKYESARKALLLGLEEIKKKAENSSFRAEAAIRRHRQGRLEKKEQEETLKTLDAANSFISESAVKEIAGFLLSDTSGWEAEIAKTTGDPLLRHLEYSRRFHRSLAEAADYNLLALALKGYEEVP